MGDSFPVLVSRLTSLGLREDALPNRQKYVFEGGHRCGECYKKQQDQQARAAAVQESATARAPEREECPTPKKKQRTPIVPVPSCTHVAYQVGLYS